MTKLKTLAEKIDEWMEVEVPILVLRKKFKYVFFFSSFFFHQVAYAFPLSNEGEEATRLLAKREALIKLQGDATIVTCYFLIPKLLQNHDFPEKLQYKEVGGDDHRLSFEFDDWTLSSPAAASPPRLRLNAKGIFG